MRVGGEAGGPRRRAWRKGWLRPESLERSGARGNRGSPCGRQEALQAWRWGRKAGSQAGMGGPGRWRLGA